MTRRNARIVAEYLHEEWSERTIGAGTANGGDYGRPHRGRDSQDCRAEAEAGAAEARSRSRRGICALQRLPICVNACTYSRSAEGVIPLRAEPSTVH
jgi:hypothetical protein